jgi:hypothetical protein
VPAKSFSRRGRRKGLAAETLEATQNLKVTIQGNSSSSSSSNNEKITLNRSKSRRIERLQLEQKILRWLEDILNKPPTSLGDRLDCALQSGVVLCDLMRVCAPNSIRKIFRNAKPGTFHAHDNISQFIKATRKILGMDETFTFGSDYLSSDDESLKQDIKMRFVRSLFLSFSLSLSLNLHSTL